MALTSKFRNRIRNRTMKIMPPPKSRCRSSRLRLNKSCICALHAFSLSPKSIVPEPKRQKYPPRPPPPTIIICHLGQPFLFSFSLLALCLLRGLCHPVDIALSLLYNLNVVQKSEYIRVVFFPFLSLSFLFPTFSFHFFVKIH